MVKSSIDMPVHPTWIEIPAGATTAIYYVPTKKVYFWKGEDVHWDTGEWMDCKAAQLTTVTEFLERNESRIVWKRATQDPALISGADALRALADGKDVEANNSDFGYWIDARNLSVKDFFDDIHIFRLKPQTIKLELEIPAPYKAKIGGRDDTSFVLNVGRHQYCYKTEEDYTKARDALEAVFDAAVRGTNS
ncbi:TPA: hypothetical protein ACJETM_000800 [Acinetobacter baumannii]